MDRDAIVRAVNAVPYWRHRIRLPYGVETPGRIGQDLLSRLGLPEQLGGARVLDIGTFDGLCAFEAERRGAQEVVAIDTWSGEGSDNPHWWHQVHTGGAGFKVAQALLKSSVTGRECSVYALDPSKDGRYDYVLCCGLLYHLRDPLTALEKALSVTRGVLLIESAFVDFRGQDEATLVFTRRRKASTNPSNWWELSRQALEDLCYVAGARSVHTTNTTHCQTTRRTVRFTGQTLTLYAEPRAGARPLGHAAPDEELLVDSRRYTFRDQCYWLRVRTPPRCGSDGHYGWLCCDGESPPPAISEQAVQTDRLEGRLTLRVSP